MMMEGAIPSSVTFENGRLFIVPPAGGKLPLIAESETRFSGSGAPVIFRDSAAR
jgi:hypothetical protein